MHIKIKHMMFLLTTLAILSMLIAACGPKATVEAPATTPETEAKVTEAPETKAPEPEATKAEQPATTEPEKTEIVGGYAQPEDFLDLDPASGSASEIQVWNNVYETLTYTPVEDTQVSMPRLATSWESNEDGTEWTFHLREGVKFHDGTDFTAEAVKYSYERSLKLSLSGAYILEPISEIVVVDDYTVKFVLKWPAPMDIVTASTYTVFILSPTTTEKYAAADGVWFNEGHDTGTGPYMIESLERSKRVVLKRFDDYWRGWEPGQFDRVILDVVEDAIVLQQMIESGETDISWGIPQENRPLFEARDDIKLVEENTFVVHYIPINTKHPPLDNKLVRQALSYTYPYQVVIDSVLGGYGVQAIGIVPPGIWGQCNDCFQYSYDLEKAKALLTEAGYPDGGFELEITIFAGFGEMEQSTELWKAELAKLNIELKIIPMTTEALYARSRSSPKEAPDLVEFSWWQDIVHPFAFMQLEWMCEEEIFYNWSYYCNPELDKLVADGYSVSASDRKAAVEMFKKAQAILIEDAPALFTYDEVKTWYVRSDIEGFVPNPAYTSVVFWYDLKRSQ
jgi:peptide/nickel transport system substrate-binding protein